jgi:hypothetical protein
VSNCSEFERQSAYLPILFIGFPAVTQGIVELTVVKPLCDQFGRITAEYMRKTTHQRSYFLFTYDSLPTALRASHQLRRRRDLLGDRRAEVTLLLDPHAVLRGRDLSHSLRHFAPVAPTCTPPTCAPVHEYYYEPYANRHHEENYFGQQYPSIQQFINGITASKNGLSEELLAQVPKRQGEGKEGEGK